MTFINVIGSVDVTVVVNVFLLFMALLCSCC